MILSVNKKFSVNQILTFSVNFYFLVVSASISRYD